MTIYPSQPLADLLTAVDADLAQLLIISPDFFEIKEAGSAAPEATRYNLKMVQS